MNSTKPRLLVLYIDFDDDLSECGIQTPLIGIEQVLNAATKFALCKPTDSDLNALFHAIKIYNSLKARNQNVEIAVAAGSRTEPRYEASMRLVESLDRIKRMTSAERTIVVLDSIEDERAIPLIAQRFDIVGIETVVVEQARSIETFYTLLLKVGRKVLTEGTYARAILGYPGFALLILTILSLFNLTHLAIYAILIFLSMLMILRGFGLTSYIKDFVQRPLKILTFSLMIFLIGLAIYLGYLDAINALAQGRASLLGAIAMAIQDYAHLVLLAIAIPLIVQILREFYGEHSRSLILRIALLTDLLLAYILAQNLALVLRAGAGASVFAVTNSIVVVVAMITITAISEAVARRK